jgi:PAT family beta-lactamase induction signal transducer AmpG
MNLLNSKPGRLVTFGGLYLSEGIPGGFLMMAIATEIQGRGMEGTGVYSLFITMLAIPWVWKFLMGPFVDNLRLRRFGARKQWIVMSQSIMLLALGGAMIFLPETIEVPDIEVSGIAGTIEALYLSGIGLFGGLLFLHNFFAATQDAAIDALACQVLREEERGLANGVMFSCTHLGYLVGGSGVLWLTGTVGNFEASSLFVIVTMACILTGVIFFVKEKSAAEEIAEGILPAPEPGHSGFTAAKEQIIDYFKTIWKKVFLSKNGFLTVLLALTPIGALALSMLLSAMIAPRLGMTYKEIAALNTASTAVFIPFCLLGGWLSDRFNRRAVLAITASLTVLPSIWIALQFRQAGWDHPPEPINGEWPREEALIVSWWIATLAFSVFNGLKYAVKNALYMDIVTPKIAATQFTALMSLTNLTNLYSKVWQGQALDTNFGWNWTVSKVIFVDAAIGLLFLVVLYFIKPSQEQKPAPTGIES